MAESLGRFTSHSSTDSCSSTDSHSSTSSLSSLLLPPLSSLLLPSPLPLVRSDIRSDVDLLAKSFSHFAPFGPRHSPLYATDTPQYPPHLLPASSSLRSFYPGCRKVNIVYRPPRFKLPPSDSSFSPPSFSLSAPVVRVGNESKEPREETAQARDSRKRTSESISEGVVEDSDPKENSKRGRKDEISTSPPISSKENTDSLSALVTESSVETSRVRHLTVEIPNERNDTIPEVAEWRRKHKQIEAALEKAVQANRVLKLKEAAYLIRIEALEKQVEKMRIAALSGRPC